MSMAKVFGSTPRVMFSGQCQCHDSPVIVVREKKKGTWPVDPSVVQDEGTKTGEWGNLGPRWGIETNIE